MVIILMALLVIAILVALYYKSKAEEFESLYELNRDYADYLYSRPKATWESPPASPKPFIQLNKDGSIAKKRGPKPKGAKK